MGVFTLTPIIDPNYPKYMDGQGDRGYREFFGKKPHPAPKAGDPPGQLYNMENDVREMKNVYAQHPELVQRMKDTLKKIKGEAL
jgi:hypothetical protein